MGPYWFKIIDDQNTSNVIVASLTLAVEALKDFQLQGNIKNARRDFHPITTVREAFGESNTRRLLALCQVEDTEDLPEAPCVV